MQTNDESRGIFSDSYLWLKENKPNELQCIKDRYPNRYGKQRDKYMAEMIETAKKLKGEIKI